MKDDQLTPKERFRRLVAGEPIDRVPVALSASLYAAKVSGIPFREFWTDPDQSLRAQEWAAELHDWDDTPAYSYGWSDWAGWDFGGEVTIPDKDIGFPFVSERPVRGLSDVDKLNVPDPWTAPVMSQRIRCAHLNMESIGKADLHFNITGMVASLAGNDLVLRWYRTNPAAVHTLYRKVMDYALRIIDVYVTEFGGENISVMETFPLDSQNMVSPQTFAEFGFVYNCELNQKLLSVGVKRVHLHLCGNHTASLPSWKQMSVPRRTVVSMGSDMDIKLTADFFGTDYIICGNVSTELLQSGTPEAVMASCREIILKLKDHPGGFILSPACSLPPLTPPVNVYAMLKAARTFGRYE